MAELDVKKQVRNKPLVKRLEIELINQDIKSFVNNGKSFKVSQIVTMNSKVLLSRKDEFIKELLNDPIIERTYTQTVLDVIKEDMGSSNIL